LPLHSQPVVEHDQEDGPFRSMVSVLCAALIAECRSSTSTRNPGQRGTEPVHKNGPGGHVCEGQLTHTPIDATEAWT